MGGGGGREREREGGGGRRIRSRKRQGEKGSNKLKETMLDGEHGEASKGICVL